MKQYRWLAGGGSRWSEEMSDELHHYTIVVQVNDPDPRERAVLAKFRKAVKKEFPGTVDAALATKEKSGFEREEVRKAAGVIRPLAPLFHDERKKRRASYKKKPKN
jgi:hypothetical protein